MTIQRAYEARQRGVAADPLAVLVFWLALIDLGMLAAVLVQRYGG